ncbi:BTB/POZ domain-containing protein 2-like [Sitodiplosis mosellana]|uniref:BTB/POZ domain-containing protein 2-like n=1 Tax=Sitodiplosis mosellana TaxID=263140 RepID=UPI002443ED1D|nr:BTB/POZ domain-containing protein 2-like [Sitodiplosis mosellana]
MSVFNPLTSDYSSQVFSTIGRNLYLESELADVHFVFRANDGNERVPAHKLLLMAHSDVFATMFNGSWKEMDMVKIGDVSAAAFKEFLQFFYLGQVKLTMENVAAVMNLGEMYNVHECSAVCSKFVKNNLNIDNILRIYGLAILLNQENLKIACKIFIGSNIKALLKSTGFLTCDRKELATILQLNWITCTEVELFEACMSWVKAVSKQDDLTEELVHDHLGDLFHEIRFGSMSLQSFAALIPKYGNTFSFHEQQEIIQMIADPSFHPTMFVGNRTKRCSSAEGCSASMDIHCERLISQSGSLMPYEIKNLETTVFSTNEPVLLRAIGCGMVGIFTQNNYSVLEKDGVPTNITLVEVSDLNDEVILYNANDVLNSAEDLRIFLTKPVIVRPGFTYEIRLEQTLPKSCCTMDLLKSRVELKSGIVIQFHRETTLEDDPTIARGLIFELIFQRIDDNVYCNFL